MLTDNDVRVLLVRAKSGNDHKAALGLISHFRDMLADGGDCDRGMLDEYLLDAFEKILGHGGEKQLSADQAFGLKPQKGRHERPDTTARDVQIAAYVEYLMRYKSTRWEDATGQAANYFCDENSGDRMVSVAHAKYKKNLAFVDEAFLADMLPEDLLQS